jgi:hypothetical protein
MVQPSFIPPRAIRELRDLTRRRKRLLGNSTSERNRVQKVLEDANVKLGNVLSDVFGASGQLMLDALLKGQATPEQVAQLAQRKAKKKIPQIITALEGHQMSAHHRQLIRYRLEHLHFLEEQILKLDSDITAKIRAAQLKPQWQLLQTVPAIRETSAATILAETGGDMTTFLSVKHLSSWAATVKRNCFLKEKFWRIVTKTRDHKKGPALIAVAHTLLQPVFPALSTGKPYLERGLPKLGRNRGDSLYTIPSWEAKMDIPVYCPKSGWSSVPKRTGVWDRAARLFSFAPLRRRKYRLSVSPWRSALLVDSLAVHNRRFTKPKHHN